MTEEERTACIKRIAKDVSEIRRMLLGNGKIGMVSQVLILWRGAWWVAGAGAVAVIGIVVNHFLL